MLSSGLNLIQQALSIYSGNLRLIVSNRRFGAMFNLPRELTIPGARFDETIRFLAQNGEYGAVDDIDEFVAKRVQQALAFEPHYMERQRANHRWISVEGGPLRQGGWITVYTDITEIKRQETILRARSDELSEELLSRSEELARTNRALEATVNRLHETQMHLEAAETRVRLANETTPAHIARLDRNERYTYSNRRLPLAPANGADDIVGHTAEAVLGSTIYASIAPALHTALAGKPKVVEFDVPRENRHIRAAFTPDTDDADRVTGAYVLSMETTPTATNDKAGNAKGAIAEFDCHKVNFPALTLSSNSRPPEPLSVAEAALLRHLLTSPNQLVSRDAIRGNLKQGSDASDRAIDVRLSRLRAKLGDSPRRPKLIRTIYGAGYIFVGDVKWVG
ncbi:MAG: PAS-domain containing protein [Pseudomonadota bacterium]